MMLAITRTLAHAIKETSNSFKVVLLTGPWQVGKITLLQEVQKSSRSYVTLDDLGMVVDREKQNGMFWLIGSQHFEMMRCAHGKCIGFLARILKTSFTDYPSKLRIHKPS